MDKHRKVAEDNSHSCMTCQHYRVKFLMRISFETGHPANGICECQDNGFYYTCNAFVCDDYREVNK